MKYFTDNDLNSLVFFQVPKVLIYGEKYKNMKPNTMKLYIVLSDRIKLSMMKGWKDDGKYYVRLSEKTAEKLLNLSRATFIRCKKELEEFGLLEQKQEGLNKTNKLFVGQLDYTEEDVYKMNNEMDDLLEDAEETAKSIDISRKYQNDTSGSIKMELQEVSKRYSINNNFNNNDLNKNNNFVNKNSFVNKDSNESSNQSLKIEENEKDDKMIDLVAKNLSSSEKTEKLKEQTIYKLTNEYRKKGLSKELCLRVSEEARKKKDVKNFGGYLRSCLEGVLYKSQVKRGLKDPAEKLNEIAEKSNIPFYNWLKE